MRDRACVAAVALCGVALVFPTGAGAATNLMQRAGSAGCITETGSSGECQDGRGLVGAASLALSPDGANAYVASSQWNSVAILTRNTADGALVPVSDVSGCFHSHEALYPDCTQARELGGADGVGVSHDGKSVYVTAAADDAIVVFDRNPLTGALSLSAGTDGCLNADGSDSCAEARGIDSPRALVISPDDENVYVASSGTGGGIAVFDRDTTSGDLTQKAGTAGCLNPSAADGCALSPPQLLDARGIAISPDGDNLYAGARSQEALTIYDRGADGELTPKPGTAGCIDEPGSSGCQDGAALIDPDGVTVSPGGENVYVAASRSDAIAIFDRDTTSGELTQKAGTAGCISNSGASDPLQAGTTGGACQNGIAMDGLNSIAILPDGSALYASTANSSGVAVFERRTDGTLAQRPGTAGCITDSGYEDQTLYWTAGTCADGSALLGADGIVTSGDGRFAYTAALQGGVGVFDVVDAPQPQPPLPEQPPAEPGPAGSSLACKHALADRKTALRHLEGAKRTLRSLARKASGQRAGKARPGGLRNARRRARTWRRRLRGAKRRVRAFCPAAP